MTSQSASSRRHTGLAGHQSLPIQVVQCAVHTVELLLHGRLHLRRERIGATVPLPDGRTFDVFRESTCDGDTGPEPVTLAVWFHLLGVPRGSRIRRFLFERASLVNTILFAGFDGYRVKLWMVDPVTADYAGLYSWRSAEEAALYARYIVRILTPFSTKGPVGYLVLPDRAFEEYLASPEPA